MHECMNEYGDKDGMPVERVGGRMETRVQGQPGTTRGELGTWGTGIQNRSPGCVPDPPVGGVGVYSGSEGPDHEGQEGGRG